MGTFFSSISPDLLTGAGIASVVVALVLSGLLVPRWTHIRMLTIQSEAHSIALKVQADAHAAVVKVLTDQNALTVIEKAEHRDGAKVWQEAAQELLAQNRTMLEQNTTTVHALEGIRAGLVERASRDGTQ